MSISSSALWKKFYFRLPIYLIGGILIFYTSGVLAMDKLLFPVDDETRSPRCGNVILLSGKEKLDAFFVRGKAGMPVILYSHGNGETLEGIMPLLQSFVRRGYTVMAYDYAGYGASTGYPGEKQSYLDADAAYKYLTGEANFPPEKIVVMGFSVGSGPSCYLAEKYPVKALIIISGFASAAQVLLPFSVPFDKFPNAARLRNCNVPLLIIHGRNDRIVPFRNGEKLFASSIAAYKNFYAEDAGHNDIFYRTVGFFSKVEKFLKDVPPRQLSR